MEERHSLTVNAAGSNPAAPATIVIGSSERLVIGQMYPRRRVTDGDRTPYEVSFVPVRETTETAWRAFCEARGVDLRWAVVDKDHKFYEVLMD